MGESQRGAVHSHQDVSRHQETSGSLLQPGDCLCSKVSHRQPFVPHLFVFSSRCADIDLNLDGNVFSRLPSVAEADPFLAFSSEDLAGMDKEVEDILSGESDSDTDGEAGLAGGDEEGNEGSSSEDSLTGVSRGHKRKLGDVQAEEAEEDSNLETPGKQFISGDQVPSDYEVGRFSDDSGDEGEEEEEGDWSLMGAALEKELM